MSVPSRGSRGVIARTHRWYSQDQQDDQAPVFPTLPVVTFDPAPFAGDFGWDAVRDVSTVQRRFQPDTEAWTPLPNLTVATPAQDAGLWQEQPGQEASLARRWFAPDAEQAPPWLPPLFTIDPAVVQGGYDAQQDRDRTPRWYQPEDAFEAPAFPTPPAFDPTVLDFGYDAQQDRNSARPWVPPDDAFEAPAFPTLPVAGFDPALVDYGRDPQQDRSVRATWFTPDLPTEGLTPFGIRDFGYDAQQDRDRTQRWFALEDAAVVQPPAPPAFDPALLPHDDETQQLRSSDQRWFAQDAAFDGFEPPPPTADATVPEQAPLWIDGTAQQDRLPLPWLFADVLLGVMATTGTLPPAIPTELDDFGWDAQQDHPPLPWLFADVLLGVAATTQFDPTILDFGWDAQQDRSISQRWFAPEIETSVLRPLSFVTTATVPEQAPLWQEQPYPLAGNRQRWYDPSVEPVPGPLKDTLFTTTPIPDYPRVLIDATTGDVYLYIGSNFIVPAS